MIVYRHFILSARDDDAATFDARFLLVRDLILMRIIDGTCHVDVIELYSYH